MSVVDELKLLLLKEPSEDQNDQISDLQRVCFTGVTEAEAEEDFYYSPAVQVLAYYGEELVGWAGVHVTEQEYNQLPILIGGYGVCTHPEFRRKGIATKVLHEAIPYLLNQGCDIGFLSIDEANKPSIALHQKFGFVSLPRSFSWMNKNGLVKQSLGGMIAPLGSGEKFDLVLNGSEALHVGNGYW